VVVNLFLQTPEVVDSDTTAVVFSAKQTRSKE
jgi:hypothetical protein